MAAFSLSASASSSVKFSPLPRPRPPDTTMRALVSSGRSDFVSSWPVTFDVGQSPAAAGIFSIAALPPVAGAASNAVARTVITLIGSFELHRRERVAGVDRAHEGVRRFDAGDVRDLRDVQLRGDARHHVLAEARCRRQHMRIAAARDHCQRRRSDVLGRRLPQMGASTRQHLGRRPRPQRLPRPRHRRRRPRRGHGCRRRAFAPP